MSSSRSDRPTVNTSNAGNNPPKTISNGPIRPGTVAARIQACLERDYSAQETICGPPTTWQRASSGPYAREAGQDVRKQAYKDHPTERTAPAGRARRDTVSQVPEFSVRAPARPVQATAPSTSSNGPVEGQKSEEAVDTSQAYGRRLTQTFEAPATRRSSRAWEHQPTTGRVERGVDGRFVVIGPEQRSQFEVTSPFAVEAKREGPNTGKHDKPTKSVCFQEAKTTDVKRSESQAPQPHHRNAQGAHEQVVEPQEESTSDKHHETSDLSESIESACVGPPASKAFPSKPMFGSRYLDAILPEPIFRAGQRWFRPTKGSDVGINARKAPGKESAQHSDTLSESVSTITEISSSPASQTPQAVASPGATKELITDGEDHQTSIAKGEDTHDLDIAINLLDSIILEHRDTLTRITTNLSAELLHLSTSINTIHCGSPEATPSTHTTPSQRIKSLAPKLRHDANVFTVLLRLVDRTASSLHVDLANAPKSSSEAAADQRHRASILGPPSPPLPRPLLRKMASAPCAIGGAGVQEARFATPPESPRVETGEGKWLREEEEVMHGACGHGSAREVCPWCRFVEGKRLGRVGERAAHGYSSVESLLREYGI